MVEFVAPLNSKKHRLVPLIRSFTWDRLYVVVIGKLNLPESFVAN